MESWLVLVSGTSGTSEMGEISMGWMGEVGSDLILISRVAAAAGTSQVSGIDSREVPMRSWYSCLISGICLPWKVMLMCLTIDHLL